MKPTMTSHQAKQFERVSTGNYALLRGQLKCACNPYEDCFTYLRWLAQGFQVQRGQHGYRLPLVKIVIVEDEDTGENVSKRLITVSVVFCRCQVKSNGTGHNGNGHNGNGHSEPAPVAVTAPTNNLPAEPKQTKVEDSIMTGWRLV